MKERLTGAIILVALIVVLVPELLTGPIRTKAAPAASALGARAAHAQPPLRTYSLTLTAGAPAREALVSPAPSAGSSPESSAQRPTESPQETPQESPASAHAPASRTAPVHADASGLAPRRATMGAGLQLAQTPAPLPPRGARASGSSRGWVVQLGSFASHQNADRLARSLKRRGFRMSVSPARAGARVLWRVRAGPAHDRASAKHLAARLRSLGYRSELLPLS